MEVTGMDPHTAKLAVELQLADTNEILETLGAAEDSYAAFEIMKTALHSMLPLLEGQVLAMDTIRYDYASQVLLETLIREE